MTRDSQPDFTRAIQSEFEPGRYLAALKLLAASQQGNILTIEFRAPYLRPGRYRINIPLPHSVGHDLWRAYAETPDLSDWTRWGIAVPLLEAFETEAPTAQLQADGYIGLELR